MFGASSGKLPTVMGHRFSQVPQADIPRSSFDRSHGHKTTFNSGYLVPFYVDEALPGDTFNLSATTFARMATPIAPLMDNLYCDTFFFAVPLRLIWDNFKKMMGEQANPGDSTSYLVPQVSSPTGGHVVGSLSDYFGLPTAGTNGVGAGNTVTHSSLWHRAYNLIWNEWFRDENLQNSVTVDKGDGPDTLSNYVLLKRGKRHDYFTSCLPWAQKGTAVTIPLGTEAQVKGIGLRTQAGWSAGPFTAYEMDGAHSYAYRKIMDGSVSDTQFIVEENAATGNPYIRADLTNATAATINSLRQAFQIQKMYERDARGGTRYIELVLSHFGVQSPDLRSTRPEFLGGGSAPITITPVPQTSVTSTTPQGNLAGFGTFSHSGTGFVKSFTEHCVLIGLINVRADLNYQQGLHKMFQRRSRLDFYWPALSHLGEQAVLNSEIFCDGSANDAGVFGYQERYAEYRYKPSLVTGQFRSTYSTPLDMWHLAQKFTSLPALNSTFIQDAPPISRVIAVPSQPEFLLDSYIRLNCVRPMPTYSVPGLIDHF